MASDLDVIDVASVVVEARKRLAAHANQAVQSIIELAEMADSEQVRLAAAVKLLGLLGVTEVQKAEVEVGVKRAQEEVDHELSSVLDRLEAGRRERSLQAQKALPAGELILDAEAETVETGGTQASRVPLEGLQETLDHDGEASDAA